MHTHIVHAHTHAGVPYDLSPEFIQELFTKHKIDYIIHGDDPCLLPDGTDAYAHAKRLGRFCMVRAACMLPPQVHSSRAKHSLWGVLCRGSRPRYRCHQQNAYASGQQVLLQSGALRGTPGRRPAVKSLLRGLASYSALNATDACFSWPHVDLCGRPGATITSCLLRTAPSKNVLALGLCQINAQACNFWVCIAPWPYLAACPA